MWLLCTLLTFFAWGTADLFYKIGNNSKDEYNYLKTGIMVGIVMGIHATIYLVVKQLSINPMDLLKYLPVSLCYIVSMVIGYRGLKYLELSICSPIQNTSGIITAFLLLIFFQEKLNSFAYVAFFLIFIGILGLSFLQLKENEHERKDFQKKNTIKKVLTLTILFPLGYCFIDGLGTFLDAIYLDYQGIISEDAALIAYEYTFFLYAIITYLYLKIKKQPFQIKKEKSKLLAAIFETAGQFFYVFAMSGGSVIAAPIIGSYCILSMILSRIFLKEKLTKKEYVSIFLVIIGIVILSILDI